MSFVSELKLERLVRRGRQSSRLHTLTIWIVPLVIFVDCLIIILSSLVAGWAYSHAAFGAAGAATLPSTLSWVVFLDFVVIGAYRHNYAIDQLLNRNRQIYETVSAWALVFSLLLVTAFLLKFGADISRGATLLFFVLGGSCLSAWRALLAAFLVRAKENGAVAATGVVVLSEKSLNCDLVESLHQSGLQIRKNLILSDESDFSNIAKQVLEESIKDVSIEHVLVELPWTQGERIRRLTQELAILPLSVRLLPDLEVAPFIERQIIKVGTIWTAEIQRMPLSLPEQIAKRVFDVSVASCLGFLLLPVMAIAAVCIKLDSAGPVIFTQTRIGFNNRAFRIYKFRTLRTLEDGPILKQVTQDDPRMTRCGRFLRQFSIDEMPQLLNVLRGEMSLVGPRPHAVAHNSQYASSIVNYAFRHHVKPGLTGWAQIHGLRGETRTLAMMQRRIDFDMWYVNNWSLWLDIKITMRTIVEVVRYAFTDELRKDTAT